ncbi:hypothetical protein [Pedobacter xixiisoli]|uniref:Uncharacterized protein n=1 Tax=Pedobacter xixiisoli TaxID=1476464 RepID=A0A286A8X8_9SPHI|nr:hypothetical protein [Pedobacter xixiisoli]SOD18342.1 hypothetical protein SAMN06297358_2951 [Pedobacter xixiisoli]
MRKLIAFMVALVSISAFAQKTPPPKVVRLAGTSDILKTDKRSADFLIKNTKFNVYLGYQKPEEMRRQKKGDTLQVYKIALDKRKFSELEVVKFATNGNEIIIDGKYNVSKDTLTVIQNFYDYIGSYCITTKYIADKYGLKKTSENMKAIKSERLTKRHRKPAEMKAPPEIKN